MDRIIAEKKIDELIKFLNYHSYLYYNGLETEISDSEWDMNYRTLLILEADNPDIPIRENSPSQCVGATAIEKEIIKITDESTYKEVPLYIKKYMSFIRAVKRFDNRFLEDNKFLILIILRNVYYLFKERIKSRVFIYYAKNSIAIQFRGKDLLYDNIIYHKIHICLVDTNRIKRVNYCPNLRLININHNVNYGKYEYNDYLVLI